MTVNFGSISADPVVDFDSPKQSASLSAPKPTFIVDAIGQKPPFANDGNSQWPCSSALAPPPHDWAPVLETKAKAAVR
jgi:hypothetical protein